VHAFRPLLRKSLFNLFAMRDLFWDGRVQLDDGTAAQAHDLMDRHRRGPEDHHKIDGDFIKRWHWDPD